MELNNYLQSLYGIGSAGKLLQWETKYIGPSHKGDWQAIAISMHNKLSMGIDVDQDDEQSKMLSLVEEPQKPKLPLCNLLHKKHCLPTEGLRSSEGSC